MSRSAHASQTYRVFMLGFRPWLRVSRIVDERIAAPRLATPRVRVPAGSVGIAGARPASIRRDARRLAADWPHAD